MQVGAGGRTGGSKRSVGSNQVSVRVRVGSRREVTRCVVRWARVDVVDR